MQRRVNVADRRGEVHARLEGNLNTALDIGGDVVLRLHARRGDDAGETFALRRQQGHVERERAEHIGQRERQHGVAGAELEWTTDGVDSVREYQSGSGAEGRVERAAEAPVEAPLLHECLSRLDDARFDHHLPIGHIDRFDEIAHRLQIRRNLTDDQLIGALVDDDPRARRSDVLEQSGDVARACI